MKKRRRINPDTLVLLRQIFIGVVVIGITALLVTGIWYGSRIEQLTISTVEIEGGETIDHKEVEAKILPILEGTYLGLVPRKFSWFYPREEMLETMQSIDRVHTISIVKIDATKLKISFDEYIPVALWCTDTASDDCFFVDAEAYAFTKAPSLTGGSFLRFVTLDKEARPRESLLDKNVFDSVLLLTSLLAESNWFVSVVEIDQVNDIFLKIVGGGELKVSANDSPERIYENLLVVLGASEFAHIKPGNFKYIDLRFGAKVFVNEELADPKVETASGTATSIEEI